MRDYQRKNTPYYLPPALYRRVLSIVRDYPRMITIYGHEGEQNAPDYRADIQAIERALDQIPEEYAGDILQDIREGKRTGTKEKAAACRVWRERFLFSVAVFRGWI